jgi:transcription termination factor Rho
VTDTDLITAGESTDGNQLSNSVNTDNPDVKTNAPVGSLSTMVLPELRALANQAGVKGTSGMRKNELIAAIQERRGQANGVTTGDGPSSQDHAESGPAPSTEVAVAQGEQSDSTAEAPRRDRRGASRETGSATRAAAESDRNGTTTREDATEKAGNRQRGQQDTKTDEGGPDADAGGQQPRGEDDGDGRQGRSAIAGAAVNARAKGPKLNCVRTTSSSR